jgi:hypothetical protein
VTAPKPARTSPRTQSPALVQEVEGYLLLQAQLDQAQQEAAALCACLPWLTSGQAEDLTRHYTEQRRQLTRQILQATTQRAAQLRSEYEARYVELRRALLRKYVLSLCLLFACCPVSYWAVR